LITQVAYTAVTLLAASRTVKGSEAVRRDRSVPSPAVAAFPGVPAKR